MENSIIWAKVVWFFHDLIFMHLFGWGVRPLYNSITRSSAEVVAKVVVFILETAFYAIVVIALVKLADYLLSKRRLSREGRMERNKQRIAKNEEIRREYEARKGNETGRSTAKSETKGSGSDYKDYDDEGDYRDYNS